jgi:hypothetical protein
MKRQSVVAALTLVGVFVFGAVTGVLVAGFQAHRHVRMMLKGTPEAVDERVTLALLGAALRLSDDERVPVREVIERHAAERDRVRSGIEPELAKIRAREREEVRAALPEAKRARFDEIVSHIDERRERLGRLLDH